ncbi:MAG: hypothetical protein RIQ88_724 [Actinomycetota bacterium]
MAALTAALGFAGATSAMAADEPGDSCTISSDGVESCADTTDVNPVDETNSDSSVDPSSGCWTTEDGTEHFLYQYYPDEISFTESEFIGLTLQECGALYTKKDLAYLRS